MTDHHGVNGLVFKGENLGRFGGGRPRSLEKQNGAENKYCKRHSFILILLSSDRRPVPEMASMSPIIVLQSLWIPSINPNYWSCALMVVHDDDICMN